MAAQEAAGTRDQALQQLPLADILWPKNKILQYLSKHAQSEVNKYSYSQYQFVSLTSGWWPHDWLQAFFTQRVSGGPGVQHYNTNSKESSKMQPLRERREKQHFGKD